ncbi:MAG: UDP-N-acetylmuramate--L-alanine ligase [Anaerolineae bacterium]|nr:UDP-N-acetylmuramate--L-alanine ligase [Anaerolineae bacterium]
MKQRAPIHFIGIGGIGLSAMAKILLEEGYRVSGSDLQSSPLTANLEALGASIYKGHAADNVGPADLVIMSSAIRPDNPEVVAARQRGIPVIKRDQMLGRMMEGRYGIAVAGTHGKTTTTALIAWLLTQAGLDPTFIVGGVVENLGTNAQAGQGEHFVIEADEYDYTFLGLKPRIAVVTVIEMDHPDCFRDLDEVTEAFIKFVRLAPKDGCVVGCGDESRVRAVIEGRGGAKGSEGEKGKPQVVTYGLGAGVDWQAVEIRANELGGSDFVALKEGQPVEAFGLQLPGLHNVKNALAAIVVADHLGLDLAGVGTALREFRGTKRRFEHKGTAGGVIVIDDYAHHPTEIQATLAAARERYPASEIWAVFQPHTYSRTRALLHEFAESFGDADHVIVVDIYPAREYDDLGVSTADIVARMTHPDARHIATLDDAADYLLRHLKAGDVLITLGAGDGYLVGERVLASLGQEAKNE